MTNSVVVTGASGSLGSAVCSVFKNNGWYVYAVVRSASSADTNRLKDVDSHIHADLTDAYDVSRAFATVDAVDAVIHCAGGIRAGLPIASCGIEVLDEMISLNLRTAYNVMQASVRPLEVRGGTFVSVAARAAINAEVNKGAYAAAKAGVIALTSTFAEEGRALGIRAHTVIPGILKTAANLEWAKNGEESTWVDPLDVARCMFTLCNTDASGASGLIVPLLEPVKNKKAHG